MLLCCGCAIYFRMLDSVIPSSRHFAPIFLGLLRDYDAQTAWIALLVCLGAACWTRASVLLRTIDRLGARPAVVAVAGTTLFGVTAICVYENYPPNMDEYAAVFQFASGHVVAQP